jgi:hypothetical protein
MSRGNAAELVAEVAVYAAEDPVAGRKRVDDAGFPPSGARAGEEQNMTLGGLKNLFESREDLAKKDRKRRPSMVDQGLRHGPNNALRHEARSRNLQKGTTRHEMGERYLICTNNVKWRFAREQPDLPLPSHGISFKQLLNDSKLMYVAPGVIGTAHERARLHMTKAELLSGQFKVGKFLWIQIAIDF